MTPLLASTSAMITLALAPPLKETPTPAPSLTRSMFSPPKVATGPVVTSAALTVAPAITCLATMAVFCSVVKLSRVPAGSALKASSVGAKTVAASTFFKVSTRPSSATSPTKIPKPSKPLATSTRSPTAAVFVAGAGAAGFLLYFL